MEIPPSTAAIIAAGFTKGKTAHPGHLILVEESEACIAILQDAAVISQLLHLPIREPNAAFPFAHVVFPDYAKEYYLPRIIAHGHTVAIMSLDQPEAGTTSQLSLF